MAIALALPAPAAVMTCAVGVTTFPAAQTPGALVWPNPSTTTRPVAGSIWQPSDFQELVAGRLAGCDECGIAFDGASVAQLDRVQRARGTEQPGDGAIDHGDAERGEPMNLGGAQLDAVRDEGHTVAVATEKPSLFQGHLALRAADHRDPLLPLFVSVAVGAVVHQRPPSLGHAGNVGELIDETGRDQEGTGGLDRAVGERDVERGVS